MANVTKEALARLAKKACKLNNQSRDNLADFAYMANGIHLTERQLNDLASLVANAKPKPSRLTGRRMS